MRRTMIVLFVMMLTFAGTALAEPPKAEPLENASEGDALDEHGSQHGAEQDSEHRFAELEKLAGALKQDREALVLAIARAHASDCRRLLALYDQIEYELLQARVDFQANSYQFGQMKSYAKRRVHLAFLSDRVIQLTDELKLFTDTAQAALKSIEFNIMRLSLIDEKLANTNQAIADFDNPDKLSSPYGGQSERKPDKRLRVREQVVPFSNSTETVVIDSQGRAYPKMFAVCFQSESSSL